jgi:uncharacterized protein YciI
MQVVILTYKVPLAEVDAHRPAHIEWLRARYADGTMLASGRKAAADGGVLLMRGERSATEELLKTDPFAVEGVADYAVHEFAATKTAPGLEALAG